METIEAIRELCKASEARLPLADSNDVTLAFAGETEHVSTQWFADRLRTLLTVAKTTGIQLWDIRTAAKAFAFENAIGLSIQNWDAVLNAIASCISSGSNLKPFDDPDWEKAIDIGRALAVTNAFPFANARVMAVAAAGRRLHERGYRLSVIDGAYKFEEGEIERITARIRELFAEFGAPDALLNLFRLLKAHYPYDFDMYLPGRRYGMGLGIREASIPFGFAINLAVSVPIPMRAPKEPEAAWKEAIDLSRDLASALDVEPYSGFAHIGTPTLRIETTVRELALFDHLFQLRQWRLSLTPNLLVEFFANDYADVFQQKLGWAPADAASLSKAITHFATKDPNVITIDALRHAGVERVLLDRMLPHFAHADGRVNAKYLSPYSAMNADFMFKPLVWLRAGYLLLPAASLMGPAFYEAAIAALRPFVSERTISDLQGSGTERVVLSLFRRANLQPTFIAAKYNLGVGSVGECDLIFETDKEILFVECKAKALSRGSMSGIPGNAVLDFAGGMFAAQTQALRHERILRSHGVITFCDGSRLEWRDRRITRLSVTLLDHGALQDQMTMRNLYTGLLHASVSAAMGHPKAKQINEFNRALDNLRSEVHQLDEAGVPVRAQTFNAASLNVGQLDVLLEGVGDLEQFRRRIATPVTTMSLNPLIEYHFLRRRKIIK